MKKFQVKLVSEKFVTIAAESEDALMAKLERMDTTEFRDLVGLPEWDTEEISDMPTELETDLVLQEGKFWTSN